MTAIGPSRLAWLGAGLGLLLAGVLFAPAHWLALAVDTGTAGQVQLPHARGTVWNGQADLLLTGGTGSRSQIALTQGLQWRLRPAWVDGSPVLRLQLTAPCCTPQGLTLTAWPQGLSGIRLRLAALQSHWPSELLAGLGTPWNTLRLEGQLALQSPGLDLRWASGRWHLQGALTLELHDAASRLSRLRPLGSYRLAVTAVADQGIATLALQTLSGELQLQGQGQWMVGGRLRFRGEAQASPEREEALSNLLNIVGRRQGTRSLLTIG